MSGLLRRLKRRGPATADENAAPTAASSESSAAPAETPADAGGSQPVPDEAGAAQPAATEGGAAQPAAAATGDAPGEQPTVILPATGEQPAAPDQSITAWTMGAGQPAAPAQPLPAWTVAIGQPTAFAAQPAPARDLPAGVDPGELAGAPPGSARRGKLRRRLRYLRNVRELLLRDLGGFTYEIHRTAGGTAQEPQRRLADAKAERISALDAEVLALESRLGEPHAEALLREPGIGGTCPECGELHASDAHFCARCGAPLDEKARAQRAAEQPTTGSHAVVEPQPASVLWAGGPRPAPVDEKEEVAEPPSAVTSQWLAGDQPTTFARPPQTDDAKAEEPATGAEPGEAAATGDETEPETVATADDATPDPVATPDDAKPDEPVTTTDDTTPDEPAATADDTTPDEPATTTDDTTPDEPAATADDTTADEPEAHEPERRDFEANGRRDEDVAPPAGSGDPLASPPERRS